VGFDDIEMAHLAQLTTMRQPMHEMGALALEKLVARMKDPAPSPTVTSFMPKLVVRKSSGAPLATAGGTTVGGNHGSTP
jgi:LacI family transcriptional regulator